MIISMIAYVDIKIRFQGEALSTVTYILNRVEIKTNLLHLKKYG